VEPVKTSTDSEKMDEAAEALEDRLVRVRRVFKVVKGGRTIGFNALVVVGNRKGGVGIGLGKANELLGAINKGRRRAQQGMEQVALQNNTIPHQVVGRYGGARVMLKPAAHGTGLIAGEAVRAVVELAGVKDILTKSLGSNNALNTAKATLDGLKQLRTAEQRRRLRGKLQKGEKGGS